MKCCWMLKNASITVFIIFELLSEKQEPVRGKITCNLDKG